MAQGELRVAWDTLKEFVKKIFIQAGMPTEDAETEADALIWANLRGVDSHGVQQMAWYVEAIAMHHIKVKPDIRIVKETPATLYIEADHALGPVVTIFAMDRVIEKAREIGIGWALIRNTTHQGAMGYYPLMAAEKGMAGIAWACSGANTAPYGARLAGIGNNPIAISVPAKRHRPLILDMATSASAASKIFVARDKGESIPQNWALDRDGNPITNPAEAATLLPLGGPKGSGLSILLECLASVMADNPKLEPALLGKEKAWGLGALVGNPDNIRLRTQNSVVAAIDISTFTDVEEYKEHIDNLIDGLKALPKAKGYREIFVPGEPEWRTYDERYQNGIPLPEVTINRLRNIAGKYGVTPPQGL
jgi:ureidoglycolate dehydrogenase (NAD+)